MKIIKIISEHKKVKVNNGNTPVKPGYKRVQAIVDDYGDITTNHIDIKNETEKNKPTK